MKIKTKTLINTISTKRKKQLIALLCLAVFASLADFVGLAALYPFLVLVTSPDLILSDAKFSWLPLFIKDLGVERALIGLSVIFFITAILSGIVRLSYAVLSIRWGMCVAAEVSSKIFSGILERPLQYTKSKKSGHLVSSVNKANDIFGLLISPLLSCFIGFLSVVLVIIPLLILEPELTLIVLGSLGLSYIAFSTWKQKKLQSNSAVIARRHAELTRTIYDGLGAIKDIKLAGLQTVFQSEFSRGIHLINRAKAQNKSFEVMPKYILESITFLVIGTLAVIASQGLETNLQSNVASSIPMLGVMILAAQRLIPALQQAYSGFAIIMGNRESIGDVLDLLDEGEGFSKCDGIGYRIEFKQSIQFKDVYFIYEKESIPIFGAVTFQIPKGCKVGVVGPSGAGKTTLLDLLAGLLTPTKGQVLIDGISLESKYLDNWLSRIAYVTQTPFLFDVSIAENIALNSSQTIDLNLMNAVLMKVGLEEKVRSLPFGLNTRIGERGAYLSGGESQRIGLARALYRGAEILVFDESTNALDQKTETRVIDNLAYLPKDTTVFIVSHQPQNLYYCDFFLIVSDGVVSLRQKLDQPSV